MKAHLENLTDLPKRQARSVVLWTLKELDIDRPDLVVRLRPAKGHKHSGRFYAHARTHWARVWEPGAEESRLITVRMPDKAKHLIIARVPQSPYGRTDRSMRGGPPPVWPENWEESIVCITAHEGWHFREFLFPQKGRPRHSEVAAEWAEYRLLNRYRERRTHATEIE